MSEKKDKNGRPSTAAVEFGGGACAVGPGATASFVLIVSTLMVTSIVFVRGHFGQI